MRTITDQIDTAFERLDHRSRSLLSRLSDGNLYTRPREIMQGMTPFSCGEYLLRSVAKVEQTFGGITTRLWDDPFEWTLPEKLSTIASVESYLDEVQATMKKGMACITDDRELAKQLPAPDQLISISELLMDTLSVAAHYQGRAFAIFQTLRDERLPRL